MELSTRLITTHSPPSATKAGQADDVVIGMRQIAVLAACKSLGSDTASQHHMLSCSTLWMWSKQRCHAWGTASSPNKVLLLFVENSLTLNCLCLCILHVIVPVMN